MDIFFPMIVGRFMDAVRPEPASPAPKPFEQQHNTVPYLFVDNQQQFSTTEWSKLLSSSQFDYQLCQVVSITWAKALASPLSHEFVQFIIEDTHNGTRTRVFSDRTDHKEPDRVILGRDWSSANNPSDQKDLPMPLKSLVFTIKPSVVELAKLLAAVTARAPEYHLTSTMCWWYAQCVFDSAKSSFGGEVKEWPFAIYAQKMVVWDYTITPKAQMEEEARNFKKQNVEGMTYHRSPNAKQELTPEDYLKKVAGMLKDGETQKEYEEALQIDGSEKIDPQLLKGAVQVIEETAPQPPAPSEEYEQAASTFMSTMRNEPDRAENLAAFEAAWQKNMRKEKNVPDDDKRQFMMQKKLYVGPGHEQKQNFDYAMQCFVGGVLRLMKEDDIGTIEEGAGSS